MTTDEIIDLAHKAGNPAITRYGLAVVTIKWMESFAALVAAAKDAEHQQTLALQQRSYEREIQLDVEAERERCLRLIDEHVRAVDAEDLVRAIKEGKE